MTKKTRLRTLLIGGLFTLFFICLVGRMYWIQVVSAADLRASAALVWERQSVLDPVRGSIVDRNDKVLTEDVPAYTISLNPQIIADQGILEDVVKGLTAILKEPDDSGAELERKIRDLATKKRENGKYYLDVEIRNEGWKIDKQKRDQVLDLYDELKPKKKRPNDSTGIYIKEDKKRFYPGGTLAAHVIGFVNKEGEAVQGLEAKFDELLTGIPGRLTTEKDGAGVELPNAKVDYQPPIDGKTLRLTIDKNIQFLLESTLEKYYKNYNPKFISAVAADPKTMEILGMANFPTFNPNEYWNIPDYANLVNQAVSAQYEPGSTFKIVTLAATVEEGIFNPNEVFQSGRLNVPGNPVYDHNRVGWGPITYLTGLKRSSNVAFAKLGYQMLGKEKLLDYIDKFGFGAKTNIDLPGEGPGKIQLQWDSDFARATFGQSLTTNTIQQLAAYSAMANGGKLMWPHVVKEVLDPKTGEVVQSFEPKVIRQVVTEETARKVSNLLEMTVDDPEGIATGLVAQVEGYRVAGKTGTANKVINGQYSTTIWLTSFCGYAPVEDPKIAVCIIADEPDLKADYHKAKEVAPTAFSEFMAQALQYYGKVSMKENKGAEFVQTEKITVPDFSDLSLEAATNMALRSKLSLNAYGQGAKVVTQYPKAGSEVIPLQPIYVAMQSPNSIGIPDLTGKSLRESLEICAFLGLNCKVSGEGYVASQKITGESGVQTVTLQLLPPGESPSQLETESEPDSNSNSDSTSEQEPDS